MREKKTTTTSRLERYVINGREYRNLSDIPAPERKMLDELLKERYKDEDQDGIPDLFQRGDTKVSTVKSEQRYSSKNDSDDIGSIFNRLLKGSGIDHDDTRNPADVRGLQGGAPDREKRYQEERRRDRVRNYIVVLALIALIVLLILR